MSLHNNTKKPVTAAESIAKCPLFKLPPELRNRIYHYAVVAMPEERLIRDFGQRLGFIRITRDDGIPENALLMTCKTIRKEAIGIFYTNHQIVPVIESLDPSSMILWSSKRISLSKQYGLELRELDSLNWDSVEVQGDRDSDNVRKWLRLTHSGVTGDESRPSDLVLLLSDVYDQNGEAGVILAMMEMAANLKALPWAVVDRCLHGFFEALWSMNGHWE